MWEEVLVELKESQSSVEVLSRLCCWVVCTVGWIGWWSCCCSTYPSIGRDVFPGRTTFHCWILRLRDHIILRRRVHHIWWWWWWWWRVCIISFVRNVRWIFRLHSICCGFSHRIWHRVIACRYGISVGWCRGHYLRLCGVVRFLVAAAHTNSDKSNYCYYNSNYRPRAESLPWRTGVTSSAGCTKRPSSCIVTYRPSSCIVTYRPSSASGA